MSVKKRYDLDFSNVAFPEFTKGARPNCVDVDPEIFYAQEYESPGSGAIKASYTNEALAKLTCKGCPLMAPCLEFALVNNEMGIWGGTNESERKRLRRKIRVSRKSLF